MNTSRNIAILCLFEAFLLCSFHTIISLGLNLSNFFFNNARYIFFINGLVCLFYFCYRVYRCPKLSRINIFTLFFLLYSFINILITAYFNNGFNVVALDSLLEFGAKVIPVSLIAISASSMYPIIKMIDYVDYFIFISCLVHLKIIISFFFNGISRDFLFSTFGVDYQLISYYASFSFVLSMFNLFIGYKYIKSRTRSNKSFQLFRFICTLIFAASSLLSGGRGGFVIIILTTFYWIVIYNLKNNKLLKFFRSICLLLTLIYSYTVFFSKNNSFILGTKRIFEFIGPSGINWEGTSGREAIYDKGLKLILESPIFGYGITGGSYVGIISTHNLFYEILIEGGLLYLIIWLLILYSFYLKINKKIKKFDGYYLILSIFMCDFIAMQFSFIYWRSTAFWFALVYIINEKDGIEIEKKNRTIELS